jgi:hypothetical protein
LTGNAVNVRSLSDFSDVEDYGLRSYNRGAVLANLLEDYYLSLKTPSNSFKAFLDSKDEYLLNIPRIEHQAAMDMMHYHLKQRGYTFGS